MVEKLEKLQFAMMVRASNPKVKEAEINTLWQDYQESGKLPNEASETLAGQSNWGYSVGIETFNQPSKEPIYSEIQSTAMDFLEGNLTAAKENIAQREDEAGALSWCVNSWKEVFDKELAKSTVKANIASTNADVEQLKKAASGELLTTNYLGGTKERISFEETFQKQRGVQFNKAAIEDCAKKADTFAQTKTAKNMIDNLKSTLGVLGSGNTVSQLLTREKSKAIFDSFKLCGVESRAKMDEILAGIENKFKDTPEVQQYGGQWQFAKEGNKYKNPPEIVRMTSSGNVEPITNEQYKIIGEELNLRLNRAYASAIGCDVPESATGEQVGTLAQKQFDRHQKEYEGSFAKAYGKKDLKELSERYVAAQQQGVENIEMVINVTSMALMVLPGGAAVTANWGLKGALAAKNSATLGNVARGMHLVDKARDTINFTQKAVGLTQKASPLIMGNMIARPAYLAEQLSSKNGMSVEEWEQWGVGVLQSSAYMALGMGASKFAEQGAAMYKTKALVSTLKNSGRSADEIAAMIKANPVKFPKDIVQSFSKINTTARLLQVPTEVALDLGSTYALNKAMNNGELRTQDWVNSLMFAINGSMLQKQFKPLSREAKADLLVNSFKEYGMTKPEALNVLKTMDDISAGKIRVRKTNDASSHPTAGENATLLPEVEVNAPRVGKVTGAKPENNFTNTIDQDTTFDTPLSAETRSQLIELVDNSRIGKNGATEGILSNLAGIEDERSFLVLASYIKENLNNPRLIELASYDDSFRMSEFIKILDDKTLSKPTPSQALNASIIGYDLYKQGGDKFLNPHRILQNKEIEHILKQPEETKERLTVLYNSKLFSQTQFDELVRLGDLDLDLKKIGRIESMVNYSLVHSHNTKFKADDIEKLLEFSNEELDIIDKRGLLREIPNRECQMTAEAIREFVNIPDNKWSVAQKRGMLGAFKNGEEVRHLNGDNIEHFAALSDSQWQRVLDRDLLTYTKPVAHSWQGKEYLGDFEIKNITKMDDAKYAELLSMKDEDGNTFSLDKVAKIAGMKTDLSSQIKQLIDKNVPLKEIDRVLEVSGALMKGNKLKFSQAKFDNALILLDKGFSAKEAARIIVSTTANPRLGNGLKTDKLAFEKALALQEKGIETLEISHIMNYCESKEGFDIVKYNAAEELITKDIKTHIYSILESFNKYPDAKEYVFQLKEAGVTDGKISDIISECIQQDDKLNNGHTRTIYFSPMESLRKPSILKKMYNQVARVKEPSTNSGVATQKSYTFNTERFKLDNELIKNDIYSYDNQEVTKLCLKDGKFNQELFDEALRISKNTDEHRRANVLNLINESENKLEFAKKIADLCETKPNSAEVVHLIKMCQRADNTFDEHMLSQIVLLSKSTGRSILKLVQNIVEQTPQEGAQRDKMFNIANSVVKDRFFSDYELKECLAKTTIDGVIDDELLSMVEKLVKAEATIPDVKSIIRLIKDNGQTGLDVLTNIGQKDNPEYIKKRGLLANFIGVLADKGVKSNIANILKNVGSLDDPNNILLPKVIEMADLKMDGEDILATLDTLKFSMNKPETFNAEYALMLDLHSQGIKRFKRLPALCYGKPDVYNKILETKNNGITNGNVIGNLLEACMYDGEINPNTFAKAMELLKEHDGERVTDIIELSKNYDGTINKKACDNLVKTLQANPKLKITNFVNRNNMFDINLYDSFHNVRNEAVLKRNQLKSAVEDLTELDVKNFFENNCRDINSSIALLGEPTFIHSYTSKLGGVQDLAKKCGELQSALSKQNYELLLQKLNPENSQRYQELQAEITALKKTFPQVQKEGGEALNKLKQEINNKTQELRQLQKGVDLDPQTKIQKVKALSVISYDEDIAKFIALIKDKTPENEKAWAEAIDKEIYEIIDVEYDAVLSKKLNLSENKYLAEILSGDDDFKENFKELVLLIKENPDKSVKDILDALPQNQKTKEMFKEIGVDYDKWVNVDKDSFVAVEVKTSADAAKLAAIEGLEAEFNDHAFKALPKEETAKILTALNKLDIELREMEEINYIGDGFANGTTKVLRLYSQDKPIEFSQIEKAISVIKKEINSNDFWSKKLDDTQMNSFRETMYTHLVKDRDIQIKNASALKTDDVANLEIRKTDMNNIQYALFLGNHGSCCTAVGTGGNQFSAPTYIKNKMISAIEIVDGKDFVGNTMCYIAEVNGRPGLVLDNFESNAKYQYNDKIRDAIFDYAKKMCEEIGQPDMPIYAAGNRHKIKMNILSHDNYEMKIIGTSGKDEIYLDFITNGRQVSGTEVDNVLLYKIR